MARPKEKVENLDLPMENVDIHSIVYKHKGISSIYNLVIYFRKSNPIEVVNIEVSRFTKKLDLVKFINQIGSKKLVLILEKAFVKEEVIKKGDSFIFSVDLQLSGQS